MAHSIRFPKGTLVVDLPSGQEGEVVAHTDRPRTRYVHDDIERAYGHLVDLGAPDGEVWISGFDLARANDVGYEDDEDTVHEPFDYEVIT